MFAVVGRIRSSWGLGNGGGGGVVVMVVKDVRDAVFNGKLCSMNQKVKF